MKIIILLSFLGTTTCYRNSGLTLKPFDFSENVKTFGEFEIDETLGGLNIFGCGIGCLKCESQTSGSSL